MNCICLRWLVLSVACAPVGASGDVVERRLRSYVTRQAFEKILGEKQGLDVALKQQVAQQTKLKGQVALLQRMHERDVTQAKLADDLVASQRKEIALIKSQLNVARTAGTKVTKALQDATGTAQLQEARQQIARLERSLILQQHDISNLTAKLALSVARYEELFEQYADPSVQHFLRAKATKVYHHPGIEGAANKTFTYVVPWANEKLTKGHHISNEIINATYNKIRSRIERSSLYSYIGNDKVEPLVPFVVGFLVYGIFVLPLAITSFCLAECVCAIKLKACLSFFHLYLSSLSLFASLFASFTEKDPLVMFATRDENVYVFAQAMFAIFTVFYLALIVAALCGTRGKPNDCGYRALQIALVALFGIAYYYLVWTPAMEDEMPRVHWLVRAWLEVPTNSQQTQQSGDPLDTASPLESPLFGMPYLLPSAVFLTFYHFEQSTEAKSGGESSEAVDKVE